MTEDDLEIAPAKVVHVIYQAREGDLAAAELQEFIAGLNDDEKASLTAIAWVGRGAFEPEDFAEALATAYAEATTPTETYLMGMPHLAENLEAGLEALGIDVSGEEEDFL
jgi:ferredoxin-NADP reductase